MRLHLATRQRHASLLARDSNQPRFTSPPWQSADEAPIAATAAIQSIIQGIPANAARLVSATAFPLAHTSEGPAAGFVLAFAAGFAAALSFHVVSRRFFPATAGTCSMIS